MSTSKIATPVGSSADLPSAFDVDAREAAKAIHWPGRLLLLVLNFVPLFHALAVIAVLVFPSWVWGYRLLGGAAVLWLAPALVCRALLLVAPLRDGAHSLGSRTFFIWWATLQLQTLFLRLPILEEILRLIPGFYSLWLRIWGASVGRLTYWAPGLEITDRSLLDVGADVITGAKSRIGGHLVRRRDDGELELLIGRVHIGDRAMIGIQSAIGPGVRLEADETTHAFFLAPPFTRWRGGRRVRSSETDTPPQPKSP